jgi:hypothetical protein
MEPDYKFRMVIRETGEEWFYRVDRYYGPLFGSMLRVITAEQAGENPPTVIVDRPCRVQHSGKQGLWCGLPEFRDSFPNRGSNL